MVGAAAANAEPAFKSYSDNLIDCMRYYEKLSLDTWCGSVTGAGIAQYKSTAFKVLKRANPTTVTYALAGGQVAFPATPPTSSTITADAMIWQTPASNGTSAAGAFSCSWTADADF
jgi:hypothetical protein